MNTNKTTSNTCRRIRAVTDLPSGARYAKALGQLGTLNGSSVGDVFVAARKFHVDPAKLLRRALESLPTN